MNINEIAWTLEQKRSEAIRERNEAQVEVARLRRNHEPIEDTYACQRCGRRDGLDAVAADDIWQQISKEAGDANILCLWCMDELACEFGLQAIVSLHFAGKVLSGTSQSEADAEHIARLCRRLEIAERAIRNSTWCVCCREEAYDALREMEQEGGGDG